MDKGRGQNRDHRGHIHSHRGQNSHRGVRFVTTVAVHNRRSCAALAQPQNQTRDSSNTLCAGTPLFSAVFPIFCSCPLYQISGLHFEVKQAMENIDDLSQEFAFCKTYQSPASLKEFIQKFLDGTSFSVVTNA